VSCIPVVVAECSSVSHDPSEIILIWWFGAQETFLIIIEYYNTLQDRHFWHNFVCMCYCNKKWCM